MPRRALARTKRRNPQAPTNGRRMWRVAPCCGAREMTKTCCATRNKRESSDAAPAQSRREPCRLSRHLHSLTEEIARGVCASSRSHTLNQSSRGCADELSSKCAHRWTHTESADRLKNTAPSRVPASGTHEHQRMPKPRRRENVLTMSGLRYRPLAHTAAKKCRTQRPSADRVGGLPNPTRWYATDFAHDVSSRTVS